MRPANEVTPKQLAALKKGKPHYRVAPRERRTVDGHVFRSLAEAQRYRLLRADPNVAWVCIEPAFLLAGVKYRPDFIYLTRGGRVVVEEVKPRLRGKFRAEALRAWKRNAAQMQSIHGIVVVLVEM